MLHKSDINRKSSVVLLISSTNPMIHRISLLFELKYDDGIVVMKYV